MTPEEGRKVDQRVDKAVTQAAQVGLLNKLEEFYLHGVIFDAVHEVMFGEREACCKAVCHLCRDSLRPVLASDGRWDHRLGEMGNVPCLAGAIRDRSINQ